jgi:hypothetical protein
MACGGTAHEVRVKGPKTKIIFYACVEEGCSALLAIALKMYSI